MIEEIKESLGVVESKEECEKKSGELYWKYKIILDGVSSPLTFSQWSYEDGKEIHKGSVKVTWTEKEGTGFEGKPVTYRNINSIGTPEEYEKDPNLPKEDKELADKAPKETMKDVAHKESSESTNGGGSPTSYREHEDRRQRMIVRQSALNYATQLEGVFLAWTLKDGDKLDVDELYEATKKRIKATAKEFEENVMRND